MIYVKMIKENFQQSFIICPGREKFLIFHVQVFVYTELYSVY